MSLEKIKIYSLGDGEFSPIENGFEFLLEKKSFYSPIKGICLQISENKKQIQIQDELQNIILIDLLDNKEIFNILENEKIELSQKICSFKDQPTKVQVKLVNDENSKYSFSYSKTQKVEKKDLILTIDQEKALKVTKTNYDSQGHPLPIGFENEWESLSKVILENVGGYKNIAATMNCATRLRLNIKDLTLINYDEIKKEKKVHGIQLKGDELQIIIGLDVYKLKDSFVNYVQKVRQGKISNVKKEKISWKAKLMKIINNIFIPVVPALCAASTVMLLKTILELSGAITAVGGDISIGDVDAFSGTVYMLAQTMFAFIGVFFCFNVVKFLGGNQIIGIFIGIVIAAPLLGGVSWTLFSIGETDFKIAGYGSSIIPQIAAGLIYVYFDRWITKWFPLSLDMIFRHAISFLVSTVSIFLFLGPFLNLIELGIYWVIIEGIGKLPGGIGVGILGLLWQPLVLTGVHAAVYVPIDKLAAAGNDVPLRLVTAGGGAVGQFAAAFMLIFITKNSKNRQVAIATTPTALFGITEPVIYGINLIKLWPFVAGCVGTSIGGFYMGALGVNCYGGAGGILTILATAPSQEAINNGANTLAYNYLHSSIGYAITILSGMGVCWLMYRERPNETKGGKHLYSTINKIFKLNNLPVDSSILNDAKAFENVYNKETMMLIRDLEKTAYQQGILQNKLEKETTDFEHKKEKYAKLSLKAYQNEKWENVEKYNNLFLSSNAGNHDYETKISNYNSKINKLNESYNSISQKAKQITNNTTSTLNNQFDNEQIKLLANNFDQIIYSLKNELALEKNDNSKLFSMKKYKKSIKQKTN